MWVCVCVCIEDKLHYLVASSDEFKCVLSNQCVLIFFCFSALISKDRKDKLFKVSE